MGRKQGQRGESQFGCLVGLALLAIAIFVAYKLVPVKIHAAVVRQEAIDQGKSAAIRGDDKIIYAIIQKADENNITLTKDNITIKRGANSISIDVDYDVPVEFPGKTIMWHFHDHSDNPLF